MGIASSVGRVSNLLAPFTSVAVRLLLRFITRLLAVKPHLSVSAFSVLCLILFCVVVSCVFSVCRSVFYVCVCFYVCCIMGLAA